MLDLRCCHYAELMKQFPDNYFDLAIVDPPYFDGPNRSGYYGQGYSKLGIERATYKSELACWEIPPPEYFIELKRVTKHQIIWGANHFADRFNASSSGWIVWDKDNGNSSFADAELAYSSFDSAVRIYKYMWNGMHQGQLGGDKSKNEKRIHPTQKPVVLYKWLLDKYALHGYKILDTHLGSGSIAIACHDYGYDLTACELDPIVFADCMDRVDKHKLQLKLF